jgi:hypothetical protein
MSEAAFSIVFNRRYESDGKQVGIFCDGPRNYRCLLCETSSDVLLPSLPFCDPPMPVSSEYDETYQSASSPCDGCGFYKMEDNRKNESNAKKSDEVLAVSRESYIMKQLQGQQGIPQIMWSGRMLWQGALNEALVMQLLGPSMQEMNERYGDQGRISLRSAVVLAVQLLSILEAVHSLVTFCASLYRHISTPPPPPPLRIFTQIQMWLHTLRYQTGKYFAGSCWIPYCPRLPSGRFWFQRSLYGAQHFRTNTGIPCQPIRDTMGCLAPPYLST